MRRLLVASIILSLAHIGVASAAGPFDGNWSGEIVGTTGPVRTCTAAVKGAVQDNVLHRDDHMGQVQTVGYPRQDCT
jgi:hypothetical protein